jgi:hypothetical protein
MNNKVFTSQDEGCQRSREEALNHKAAQQVKTKVFNLKNAILEDDFGKKGLVLWCKGHQEHYKTLSNTLREHWCPTNKAGERWCPKTHKNVQKNQKFSQILTIRLSVMG